MGKVKQWMKDPAQTYSYEFYNLEDKESPQIKKECIEPRVSVSQNISQA